MSKTYSDQEIAAFLEESKPLAINWSKQMALRPKRGHKERDIEIVGGDGNLFKLILRQNETNVLDFSVILAVYVKDTNRLFRLRRYNGKSHEHTNHLEKVRFYDFHIHMATERYQELGTREDAFAETTSRYANYRGALRCLMEDANLEIPPDPQGSLFEEI